MSVVRIPPTLRPATGGQREVRGAGETVRDVLDDLTSRFPALAGQLQYANVYVDGEDIRTLDELETPVRESSTVILLPAMAGGSLASPAGRTSRPAPLVASAAEQSPWARHLLGPASGAA
jgi:molybdopterin synthase sulfur carrier subunit